MKSGNIKITISILLFFLLLNPLYAQQLLPALQKKFGKENVEYQDSSAFKEFYIIKYRQPVDHTDSSRGSFMQLVYLGHVHHDSLMVMETNGYEMLPYQGLKYVAEPAKILNANQLIVEHRYYGFSKPDTNDRTYLNFRQIAADHHAIKSAFSDIYKNDWISTGGSKGGVTALNYSYYYPDDIKASFIYVAPVLHSLDDERMTAFLSEKRKTETGKKLFDIQHHLLQRKQVLLPAFLEILKLSNLEIGETDPETLYDFAVLEFDFNYWQYITNYDKLRKFYRTEIESLNSKGFKQSSVFTSEGDSMLAVFPMCIWFLLDKNLSDPFFYQSYTEMGTYGYEEELFKGLKHKKYSTEYLAGRYPGYSTEYVTQFNEFLKKDVKNSVFIYGAEDPWTSCKPEVSNTGNNLVIINPGTNHGTQIKDLSDADKKLVEEKINSWLKTGVQID